LADNKKLQPRLEQSGHESSRAGGRLVGAVMQTDHLLHFFRERFRTLKQHIRTLPKIHVSLPKQAHDLLRTASLLHQKNRSRPIQGTTILSQDLDQDVGMGSVS
jgi:hypothetical protein